MDLSAVYNQIAILFSLLITGYLLGKLKMIQEEMIRSLTSFILNIALPALIIAGMIIPRTSEKLKESIFILIIAFSTYAGSFIIAKIVTSIIKPPKSHKGIFEFSLMFSNVGFMGFPVIATIFGEEAIFYAVIYNIAFVTLVYTLGISLVNTSEEKYEINLKTILNTGVIASIIGFVIFALAIPIPKVLEGVISLVGNTTTPISMVVIGAMLSTLPLSRMFNNWRIYVIAIMRVFVLPLIVFAIFKYILHIDNIMLIGVPVIITGMPVAANAALVVQEYGSEPEVASQCIFISTLISIASIPLLSLLFI
ncbi:MAG TPA: AEC family transporter [Epulopiscium sp.]|nr:AEC family transporter [Candidatus Epulonipiscium sp.]